LLFAIQVIDLSVRSDPKVDQVEAEHKRKLQAPHRI